MDNTNNTFLFLKFYRISNILTLFWRNMSPDLDFVFLKLTVKKCRKFERRVAFPETFTKILNIKRDRSKQPAGRKLTGIGNLNYGII